jgi:hypothetical protein
MNLLRAIKDDNEDNGKYNNREWLLLMCCASMVTICVPKSAGNGRDHHCYLIAHIEWLRHLKSMSDDTHTLFAIFTRLVIFLFGMYTRQPYAICISLSLYLISSTILDN